MTIEEYRELLAQRAGKNKGENRKVVNARKTQRDGVKFDSRLEMFMYDLLTTYSMRFEFQKVYQLQPPFRYNGVAVRAITWKVDFYLPDHNVVIDPKGVRTQQGNMRIKMLKYKFSCAGLSPRIFLPKTRGECRTLIMQLLAETKKEGSHV